jgi:hypothetical protein
MLPKSVRAVLAVTALCALAAPSLADQISLPARKAGYWEIVLKQKSGDWVNEETYHACVASDRDESHLYEINAASKGNCDDLNIDGPEENLSWDGECEMGGLKSITKNNLKFSNPESYTLTADGTYAVDGNEGQFSKSETAKWLGADCPVGLKAGFRDKGNGVIVDEMGNRVE